MSFPQLILIFAGFLTTALGSYFIKTQLDGLLPYGRPGIVLLFVGLFFLFKGFFPESRLRRPDATELQAETREEDASLILIKSVVMVLMVIFITAFTALTTGMTPRERLQAQECERNRSTILVEISIFNDLLKGPKTPAIKTLADLEKPEIQNPTDGPGAILPSARIVPATLPRCPGGGTYTSDGDFTKETGRIHCSIRSHL